MNSSEENLKLAAIFYQASSAALLVLDAGYHFVNVNPAFTETTGYSLPELQAQGMANIFGLFVNFQHREELIASLVQRGSWRGELSIRRKNKEAFPALVLLDVIKPLDCDSDYLVGLILDISDHKRLEFELRYHAEIDSLTSLANRKLFFQRLDDAIASADRFKYTVALLYLDLDGFKQVNDCFGHGQGDNVLVEVAQRLRCCVRQVDTVARLGGDEFVLILNGTSKDMINDTARRIIEAVAFTVSENGIELPISASVGISIYPFDSLNPSTLLKYADAAMYSAKFKGKHQYCWHVN